ncbi:MAG: cell division protein ZapA [Gammaproteobacteria bacterium]|nr:cell division protein ZapA [Gammaproteobacteria bacterium]
MNAEVTRVGIRILEKEYQVACPVDERPALIASAEYLSGKMKEIRDTGKVVGLDRVAVMAALNIAAELLVARNAVPDEDADAELAARLRSLRERVESALEQGQQLEL